MDHIHYSLRVSSSLVLLLAVSFVAVTNVYKNVFFHGITSSSTLPMPVFKRHHRRRRRLDKHRIRRSYSTYRLFRRGPRLRPRRKPPYEHSSTHLDNIVLPTIASTLLWFVHPHVDDYIQRDTTSEGASLLGSRLKKKHRIVPMTHSYLFDCELAKSFYDRGLQQSTFDPCVFFSDKVIAVLFDGGTVFSAEFDQDIQDILFRFQEEDSTFNAQDIYSQSISTSSQVQDTEVLFPEGASSYFIIFLETCSRLAHRIRPNIEPFLRVESLRYYYLPILAEEINVDVRRLVCSRRSVIGG
eukprot:scaffold8156_cov122-Skeletonema_marinoi.AAC.1